MVLPLLLPAVSRVAARGVAVAVLVDHVVAAGLPQVHRHCGAVRHRQPVHLAGLQETRLEVLPRDLLACTRERARDGQATISERARSKLRKGSPLPRCVRAM